MSIQAAWLTVGAYSLFIIAATALFTKYSRSKLDLLVANRSIHWIAAGLSVAATWVWAPALFVAAEKAFLEGWVGVFWFTVPNVATLVIFAWLASKLRERVPDGFTLSAWIKDAYSTRVQRLYLGTLSLLSICAFAVQLLAGGLILQRVTGMAFLPLTVTLAIVALSYTFFSGIRASILTDWLQMSFIALIGLTFVPWAVLAAGGFEALSFTGNSGAYRSLVSGEGASVFWTFGLAATIGLLSGPFGDQSFWQRAWSVKGGSAGVRKAFVLGAAIFAVVPITMSMLGFIAAGSNLAIENTQLTNFETIMEFLPAWTFVPFLAFILSGLVSTLDSHLAAISSLAGHDLKSGSVRTSRLAMLALAVIGVALANVPGITIVAMFIFYGLLRSTTLIPTVVSILAKRAPHEAGAFYGILSGIFIGLPIFATGQLTGTVTLTVAGSLAAIVLPAIALWLTKQKIDSNVAEIESLK